MTVRIWLPAKHLRCITYYRIKSFWINWCLGTVLHKRLHVLFPFKTIKNSHLEFEARICIKHPPPSNKRPPLIKRPPLSTLFEISAPPPPLILNKSRHEFPWNMPCNTVTTVRIWLPAKHLRCITYYRIKAFELTGVWEPFFTDDCTFFSFQHNKKFSPGVRSTHLY